MKQMMEIANRTKTEPKARAKETEIDFTGLLRHRVER